VFETGLDSDKFLYYLAEFCARSYIDEQFKISQRKARDYFNALNSKEADGENAPKFSAFMHDICDNLCIMYRENDTYYFIHRSFQ